MYKLSKYTILEKMDSNTILHCLKNGATIILSDEKNIFSNIIESNFDKISTEDLNLLLDNEFLVSFDTNEASIDKDALNKIISAITDNSYLDISIDLSHLESSKVSNDFKNLFIDGITKLIDERSISQVSITLITGNTLKSHEINDFMDDLSFCLLQKSVELCIDYILLNYMSFDDNLNTNYTKIIKFVYTYDEFMRVKNMLETFLFKDFIVELWVQCTYSQSTYLSEIQTAFKGSNIMLYLDLVDENATHVIKDEGLVKYFNIFQGEVFSNRDSLFLQPLGMICRCSLANSIIVDESLNIKKCFCYSDDDANIIGCICKDGIIFNENYNKFKYSYSKMNKFKECMQCEFIFYCCMASCVWQYANNKPSCPKQKYFTNDFLRLIGQNLLT